MASWLVRSSLDRAVRAQVQAGDIALCSVLSKTLNSHSASLHPGVEIVTCDLKAGVNMNRREI